MSEVKLPIKTIKDGNKITKICVEDVYKIINRLQKSMDEAYNNSIEIINSIHKEVDDYEGELIIGTGISQPAITDAYDEEIGMNIAFMKAKLNANLKKSNFLRRIWNEYVKVLSTIDSESQKIATYIDMDLMGIRKHNPDYLIDEIY